MEKAGLNAPFVYRSRPCKKGELNKIENTHNYKPFGARNENKMHNQVKIAILNPVLVGKNKMSKASSIENATLIYQFERRPSQCVNLMKIYERRQINDVPAYGKNSSS
jgi:hypothetical protein